MNWWNRQPTSLWVLAGPALTSVVYALQLASNRPDKLIPALLLGASVGLVAVVLAQRRAARRSRAAEQPRASQPQSPAGGSAAATEPRTQS